jgi:hypothetical protein
MRICRQFFTKIARGTKELLQKSDTYEDGNEFTTEEVRHDDRPDQ